MGRSIIHQKAPREELAPGVWLDRLQPGDRRGPANEVLLPYEGGRVWTDSFILGSAEQPFQLMVPDIRLPANQYWPLHWHDCWIAVVVLDGTCMVGDWWMEPGDVLISAAGLEYGPLLIGPDGCQMFEVFARLHQQQGGYSPEYRDHPTLAGGDHVFKPREGVNRRNEGRQTLPCDGVEGLVKGRLQPGQYWDLGKADDPERGGMAYTALQPGKPVPAHSYADWHALFVMKGGLRIGSRELGVGDVILTEPGARMPAVEAGPAGAELFEVARVADSMERLA